MEESETIRNALLKYMDDTYYLKHRKIGVIITWVGLIESFMHTLNRTEKEHFEFDRLAENVLMSFNPDIWDELRMYLEKLSQMPLSFRKTVSPSELSAYLRPIEDIEFKETLKECESTGFPGIKGFEKKDK